jgi:uncharacterized membrane protein
MAEFTGERTVLVQAPIETVYEYMSDFPRHTEWNHRPTEMIKVTDGPIGVGSVFRTKERAASNLPWLLRLLSPLMEVLLGGTGYTEAEITVLEPNRRVAWNGAVPLKKGGFMVKAEWEIRLASQGEATQVTQWFHLNFLGKIGERMNPETTARMSGEEVARNLTRFKEIIEMQSEQGKTRYRPAFA